MSEIYYPCQDDDSLPLRVETTFCLNIPNDNLTIDEKRKDKDWTEAFEWHSKNFFFGKKILNRMDEENYEIVMERLKECKAVYNNFHKIEITWN